MSKNAGFATLRQLQDTVALEIANKNSQISELIAERDALERVLLKSRKSDEVLQRSDVTRKNSVGRVIAEGSILEEMQKSKGPVRAKNLYKAARFLVPTLRENTFRSYLHRLKGRGLIEQPSRGFWQLISPKESAGNTQKTSESARSADERSVIRQSSA